MLRFAYIAWLGLLAALLASTGPGRAQNAPSLMANGGFESGDAGQPAAWSCSLYPEAADAGTCLLRSSERARSGEWALKVDTDPVLGQDLTLVFNGAVSDQAAAMRKRELSLSGWVYVQPGSATRPINMRLRTFGPDASGTSTFLGDILSVQVMGKPGEWTEFQASGTTPDAQITSIDLHCGIRPDAVRTVQFLDDIWLGPPLRPPLSVQLPCTSLWLDTEVLAVEADLAPAEARGGALRFRLLDAKGREMARWQRDAASGVFGLDLPARGLVEGPYVLQAEVLSEDGRPDASAEAPLVLVGSPWKGAPARLGGGEPVGGDVAGFEAVGTTAPTDLADARPEGAEPLSPDLPMGEWERRGYVAFSRHCLDPVSRLGRPRPGEAGPIRLFACPGEYEPATISVWAIREQREVALTVGEPKGEARSIPASSIDLRVVRTVKGLPAFLERRPIVSIAAGQTQTFWLTLHVPSETPPGFYRGEVTVHPAGSEAIRLPLLLRVLPLALPAPQKGYGFWWKMDGRWNGYYSQDRDAALDQIRKQFVLLHEYGCNMASCYGMPRMTKAEDGTIAFDFGQDHWGHDRFSLADFFRLGRETGLLSTEQPIQYVGAESLHSDWVARAVGLDLDAPAFDEFYRDACRRVDRWAKEQGFTFAFACVDEIGNSAERRRDALRFYRLAQEAGVLTSVTDNSMHGGVHLMAQPQFDSVIAMRLYNFITREMIASARVSGDHLWLYNMASGGWDPKRDRFVFGSLTERCGAEGCAQWAFQWPNGNTDPYQAAAAGEATGYHYALPAPDGPLPTLALEGVREGVDDARYLALLRERSPQSAAARLDDIEPLSTDVGAYLSTRSGNSLDVRRWQMAREAMGKRAAPQRGAWHIPPAN
jgi:hypothetical protein